MKFALFILVLTFQSLQSLSQAMGRIEMRNTFQACSTAAITESFHNRILKSNPSKDIEQGYRGAVLALKAKYSANPLKKYNYCKDGLSMISNAIETSPYDLELRYLRLLIESNIPAFLGMNYNVKDDKQIILNNIGSEQDINLKQIISSFLLNSNICTDKEKKMLASK
ncbi:MAG: hypothetical protein IPN61_10170 [Bacteroidetes bacterium]|nr:hypothetical protein [Bacteroidota bacterium]